MTLYVPADTDSDSDDDDDDDNFAYPPHPHFVTLAETFNAPLNVEVMHDASSTPANLQMRASNNLGMSRVALDPLYSGTFDVVTMFAQADVLTWDGSNFDDHYDDDGDGQDDGGTVDSDSDDDTSSSATSSSSQATSTSSGLTALDAAKVRMFLPATSTSTTEAASETTGRCLEYDFISSSEIRGWVGTPPRPSQRHHHGRFGNMSHVSVVSSLNGAQLIRRRLCRGM